MASPQPTDSHTRISNELYTQILMRDFTKRQRAILDLIIRMSYGCGKKTALIPLTKHFEICGIQPNKVRKELNELHSMGVVDWNADQTRYWLIKDYEKWDCEAPSEDIQNTFRDLLKSNLEDQNGHDQKSHADQIGHDQNGQDDQKGHINMTKMGGENGPKRSYVEPEKPRGSKDESLPITNYNYIDKKKEKIVDDQLPDVNSYMFEIMKFGRDIFQPFGISQKVSYDMAEWLIKASLDVELAHVALQITRNLNKDEGFARNKLHRWLQSGIRDVESAKKFEEETFGAKRQVAASHEPRAPANKPRDERYSAFYDLFPDG